MFCKKQSITPKDIYNRFRNKKRNSFIMKKNYLLAAILCLITTAAAAQQTEQVQIPNIPLASKWLYDNNGDGKLEFINPETKYVSNDKYNHSLKTYSHTGTEISSYTFPFTLRIDNIENNFIGLGNYVGDENIDMFFKGVYYSIYDTYLFTGNTGGTFTPSIIKKPAYVGTDYNKSTEWEMPDITLDADGDGRPDLYGYNSNTKQHYFMLQQPDGTFMRKTLRVLTDEEEIDDAIIAKGDAPIVAAAPIRFSGVSLAKVIRKQLMKDGAQKAPQATMAEIAWSEDITTIDLNMDGYLDLIDNKNGGALISIDEGVYYFGTFKGIPTARDLNGDGILDYILFDSKTKTVTLQIYTGDGGFREQTLMQNMNISNVYCYDFDGDGDVDILLPFDYTESSQYAFLVFFQNNGDNTFTKKERSLPDKLYFKDCLDVDNDGIYEVIAAQWDTETRNHKLYRIKCNATSGWSVAKDAESFVDYVKWDYWGTTPPDSKSVNWIAGDLDNSGKTNFYTIQHQLICHQEGGVLRCEDLGTFNLLGTFDAVKTNNSPARMAVPTFIADAAAQVLRIEWKPGSDDLTAVPDLTYALRIGTEPGKGDILYAYANADGSRRRTGAGNCSSALFRLMRTGGWSAGNYYIAVQAVDAHGRGGAWSSEAVYSHTQLSSQFNMGYTQTTTADTLSLTLKTPKKESYQYNWNMGEGGEIVSESNGTWKVVYNTAGRKTISLQVTDGAGNKSGLTEKQLEVYAVKFEENKLGLNYQNDWQFFDADMNGKLDLVSGTAYNNPNYNIFGILEGNGQGKFTKVGRTYNSDLKPSYIHFMDFNMDGLPDFVGETNKGNLFINGDDFDFEYSTETFTANNTKGINLFENSVRFWQRVNNKEVQWIDLNNDGYPDMVSSMMYSSDNRTGIYMNAGDNKNFTRLNLIEKLEYGYTLDLNKDGFYDIICSNSQNGKVVVYLNNGNSQFTKIQTPLVYSAQITDLPDLNNDGYPDFIKLDAEKKILYCYLGDKTYMYNSQPVEIKLPTDQWLSKDYSIYDVDNNGYPDIVFYVGILYFYPNMEIRWQDIAATHPGNLQSIPSNESKGIYPFVDLNGDGVPDAKSYDILSRIKNTPPQAPLNARAAQTDEGILLSWDAAVDAETPVTQMRYNISVKEKGKSGAGSFILSPMNGLKDVGIAIPDYGGYRRGTQMIVPASRFQVGKTYQLQVQAIDLWNEHSPFSTVYEFTVESQVNIKMPQTACLGKRVNISYTGTETGVVTWHWDGGEAVAAGTNSWNVLWNTPGLKNVQVTVGGKTVDRPLKVRKNVDMAFSLPTTVLAKCEIPFTLPDLFNDPTKKVYIRTSDNMQVVTAENVSGMNVIAPSDVNKITVKRRAGSLDAVVIFPKNGTQWIELVYNDESCGELVYRQTTDVVGQNLTPQIALVTVDAGTGKTKINWTTPTDLDISIFNKIEIYKEMGSTNNFVKIDEVPLTAEMYIDQSSDPLVRKSRYRIALGTTFGGRSQMSETHCNVHVMINKGLGNAINLIWTKYEGALINSYSILRGTSPENMQIITTASGYENSFTDINAPEDAYYALSYSSSYSDKWISLEQQAMSPQYVKGTTANTISGSSNTVTTNQSVAVTFAQSLFIQSIEKNIQLTSDQPVLHLYAEILPAMATYKRVNWKITEGADLAIISESGLLTYIGRGSNGTITVKATAIDGSGISAQRTITVGGFVQTSIEEAAEAHAARNYTLYPNPAKDELRIENGEIQINRLEILDLSGKVVCQYDDSKNKINISALSRGIYFVKIETDNGVVTRKFIKE